MISPFNDCLQMLLLRRDEPRHVTLEQECERSLELQNIAHERPAIARMKFVDVRQSSKKSAHHFVHEASRAIDFRDAGRKPLANTDVPSFECQQIAELQHARRPPRLDDALAGKRRAFGMHINVEGEIEADFDRRLDPRFDDDQTLSARRLIARSQERRMMSLPGWITRQ
jgi:hypothetical protein